MIIRRARASARGAQCRGTVTLELVKTPAGWTYQVDGMTTGGLNFTWHARTPEKASRKLQDIYGDRRWKLQILETENL